MAELRFDCSSQGRRQNRAELGCELGLEGRAENPHQSRPESRCQSGSDLRFDSLVQCRGENGVHRWSYRDSSTPGWVLTAEEVLD